MYICIILYNKVSVLYIIKCIYYYVVNDYIFNNSIINDKMYIFILM